LLDGRAGAQVWRDSYDRSLTPKNLFETQSEVARQIAREVGITLTLAEEGLVNAQPTQKRPRR
jgi:TolB-like protein